jgi:RNA polymerase sigma-70 factor (ECF subfamily)
VGRASGLEPLQLGLDSRVEEALYRRNSGRVFGFCLSRLGRREDAEDALQTTFLHAVRSLRRGVVPLVESAWLLGIARNVCRERWEASGRRGLVESSCDPQELERSTAAGEERREELIGLEEALARLPEQQRRAILLRDWRGLSYDEVANQLGVSHAAVETLIFRGRQTLAEMLREEPQQTRRRLASLGHLGSIFSAIKTAFSGAAAATKVAAALGVTAVAVGGAGLATKPAPAAPTKAPAAVRSQTPSAHLPATATSRPQRASAPIAAASSRPKAGRTPAKSVPATKIARPVQAPATTPAAAKPTGEQPAAAPSTKTAPLAALPHVKAPKLPKPAPSAPLVHAPPLTGAVEALVGSKPVQTVVAAVTPAVAPVVAAVEPVVAPVVAPVTAVVAEVVPPLPPVTITPPAGLPLPPVTVTPPKLHP